MLLRPKYLYFECTQAHVYRSVRLKVTSEPAHDDVSHVKRPMLRHRGECLKSEYTERVSMHSRFAFVNSRRGTLLDTSMNGRAISVHINLPRNERYISFPNDPYCREW